MRPGAMSGSGRPTSANRAGRRTTPRDAGMRGPAGPGAASAGEPQIEKEYIANLQQQIHFLELESRFLREKSMAPGPAVKNKGVDAPTQDMELAHAAPLDEHMRMLKMKYIQMEKQYKEEMEKFQFEADDKDRKLHKMSHQLSELQDRERHLEAEHEHSKSRWIADKEELLDKKCQAELRAEKVNQEKDSLVSQKKDMLKHMEDTQVAAKKENNSLREVLAEAENRAKLAGETAEEGQKELMQLKETIACAEKELAKLKHAAEMSGSANGKVRGDDGISQREIDLMAQKKELEVECEGFKAKLREISKIAKENAALETKLHMAAAEVEEIKREKQDMDNQLGNLKLEKQERETELKQMKRQSQSEGVALSNKKADLEKVHEEAEKAAVRMAAIHHETAALKEEAIKKEAYYDDVDAEASQMKKENSLYREEVRDIKRVLEDKEDKLRTSSDENAELKFAVQKLSAELEVSKNIESLKVEEFHTLMKTNQAVSESINTLMHTMNKVPHQP